MNENLNKCELELKLFVKTYCNKCIKSSCMVRTESIYKKDGVYICEEFVKNPTYYVCISDKGYWNEKTGWLSNIKNSTFFVNNRFKLPIGENVKRISYNGNKNKPIVFFGDVIEECICGNSVGDSGFFPCLSNGDIIEPNINSKWKNLYSCADCGQIYKDLQK